MKNSDKPIYPQSENWQNDMEKHLAFPKYGSPSIEGIGLTKREYFAGLAMQGLMVQAIPGSHNSDSEGNNRYRAIHAVNMADELLKQLEQ